MLKATVDSELSHLHEAVLQTSPLREQPPEKNMRLQYPAQKTHGKVSKEEFNHHIGSSIQKPLEGAQRFNFPGQVCDEVSRKKQGVCRRNCGSGVGSKQPLTPRTMPNGLKRGPLLRSKILQERRLLAKTENVGVLDQSRNVPGRLPDFQSPAETAKIFNYVSYERIATASSSLPLSSSSPMKNRERAKHISLKQGPQFSKMLHEEKGLIVSKKNSQDARSMSVDHRYVEANRWVRTIAGEISKVRSRIMHERNQMDSGISTWARPVEQRMVPYN